MRSIISIVLIAGFLVMLRTTPTQDPISCDDKNTILTRYQTASEFSRPQVDRSSYASYLQNLPLKEQGTLVKYFNGTTKANQEIYCGVVDMDIDAVDLQQCADAVMRLRGEYLFGQGRYQEIKFNFVSDGKPRYFTDYADGDLSYTKFRKYMKYIFSYANTRSLHNEMVQVRHPNDIQIGDIFIQTGRPYGHAVIVVDLAVNSEGERQFILAQSYMPAQETQILINPLYRDSSPWYSTNQAIIETPEWTFQWSDLRRFPSLTP